jgi:hypothetical protein
MRPGATTRLVGATRILGLATKKKKKKQTQALNFRLDCFNAAMMVRKVKDLNPVKIVQK